MHHTNQIQETNRTHDTRRLHGTHGRTDDGSNRTRRRRRRGAVALVGGLAALGVAIPSSASADQAYHTYHAPLHTVGDEPLQKGFVNNIHAEGPVVYAMEYYHLVGARPRAVYTAMIELHIGDPDCSDDPSFVLPSAVIETNAAGNGHGASPKFSPTDVEMLRGDVHGVNWVVVDEAGTPAFASGCSADVLD